MPKGRKVLTTGDAAVLFYFAHSPIKENWRGKPRPTQLRDFRLSIGKRDSSPKRRAQNDKGGTGLRMTKVGQGSE